MPCTSFPSKCKWLGIKVSSPKFRWWKHGKYGVANFQRSALEIHKIVAFSAFWLEYLRIDTVCRMYSLACGKVFVLECYGKHKSIVEPRSDLNEINLRRKIVIESISVRVRSIRIYNFAHFPKCNNNKLTMLEFINIITEKHYHLILAKWGAYFRLATFTVNRKWWRRFIAIFHVFNVTCTAISLSLALGLSRRTYM